MWWRHREQDSACRRSTGAGTFNRFVVDMVSGAGSADGSIAVADVAVDKGKALAVAPQSPNVMRLVVVMVCMLVWLSFFFFFFFKPPIELYL